MAAPSPGRALKALSALSQSNLTTHRLGLALGTGTDEAKASNTMALGLPAGGGNILCSLINHTKPPQKEKKGSRGGGMTEIWRRSWYLHASCSTGFRPLTVQ